MNQFDDFESALAEGRLDDEDTRVLATLRAALDAVDPPPRDLAESVKFRLTVAALEAEVADMVASSPELAGARGTTYHRAATVTFSSETLSAMVSIEPDDAGTSTISGWTSEGDVEVELRERSRTRTTTSDAHGRFRFSGVERGLTHFVFRAHGAGDSPPVITPAIEI